MVRWAKALLFVAVLGLASCDRKTSPVSPTPSPNVTTPVSIAIGGTTSLDHPGETGRLTATATFSDGSTRDVTAEASWLGQEGAIAINGPGVVTAIRYGIGSVSASYRQAGSAIQIRVAPAGAFLVAGSVTAAGGFPLPETRVEFSSRCGTHSTMTDDLGGYVLPSQGEVTMRLERDGFGSQVKQMTVGTDWTRVDFEMQPLETADDLSGMYKLTVSASPSCVLPPEVRQRSYDARILQVRQDLFVLLTGANLVSAGGPTGFSGSRGGNAVRFVVRDTFDDGYNFIEVIEGPARRDLYYSGKAAGIADQTRIVAVFDGKLELRSGLAMLAKCEAPDHRFELARSAGATLQVRRQLLR